MKLIETTVGEKISANPANQLIKIHGDFDLYKTAGDDKRATLVEFSKYGPNSCPRSVTHVRSKSDAFPKLGKIEEEGRLRNSGRKIES